MTPAAAGLALLCCALPATLRAAPVDTSGATACAIEGWSVDDDPAGLNVRVAPRKDAPVIGRIPPERAQAGDTYAAEFRIVGSRDGWLLIEKARFADYGDGKGDRVVFPGRGWVFADKVRFLINRPELRAAPNDSARTIMMLQSKDMASGSDSAAIDHVFGCSGDFAEITAHMPDGPSSRGWATGICSNQVTTCP